MSKNLPEIIRRIARKSDTRAFRMLFDLYNDRLLKIALYFIRSQVVAEEIVADVFVSIWRNREKLTEVEKLDYYLFTSVKRKCIDSVRKNKRDKTVPMDALMEQTIKTDVHPDSEMLYLEFEAVVNSAISLLPPKTQLIYKMVKEDSLKYKEVSDLLDITEKTVEYHIGQAFKGIRQDIHKYQTSGQQVGTMFKLATLGAVMFCSSNILKSLTICLA